MNILILQGSPRANGNTAWMAEEYRKAAEAASGQGSRACCAHGKGTCSGQAYAAGDESTRKVTHGGAFRADAPCTKARGRASRASAPATREAS